MDRWWFDRDFLQRDFAFFHTKWSTSRERLFDISIHRRTVPKIGNICEAPPIRNWSRSIPKQGHSSHPFNIWIPCQNCSQLALKLSSFLFWNTVKPDWSSPHPGCVEIFFQQAAHTSFCSLADHSLECDLEKLAQCAFAWLCRYHWYDSPLNLDSHFNELWRCRPKYSTVKSTNKCFVFIACENQGLQIE